LVKRRAVEQARERLSVAEHALARIERAEALPAMSAAWVDLLTASGTVFAKLEQGAKGSSASEAWLASHKNARKTDPLLQYAHQARNSSEHSIQDISRGAEVSVSMRAGNIKPGERFGLRQLPDRRMVPATTGDPTKLEVRGRHIALVAVINRGIEFPPPTEHLGAPVSDTADCVGRHLIRYLRKMVDEAGALIIG
jgi:hypothetical protein